MHRMRCRAHPNKWIFENPTQANTHKPNSHTILCLSKKEEDEADENRPQQSAAMTVVYFPKDDEPKEVHRRLYL